ncbi:MAG: ABC transporter permease [Burkholderiales bacterium]|jgi:simple sugar transport system permease protein|nr:ABC transporter permease [Burkholderiales bacterium]
MTTVAALAATPLRAAFVRAAAAIGVFAALASLFFVSIGQPPATMFVEIARAAAGSGYAVGESLVRATPIMLCALATLVPARLGLVSVGADGQLYAGAIVGTGALLAWPLAPGPVLLSAVLVGGAIGGALWALGPALLRAFVPVHETISTLMLNWVAAMLVTWLVHGAWRNPASQGWPASIEFPDTARLPVLGDSRVHAGLALALVLAVVLHAVLTRTRSGLVLDVLRDNPRLQAVTGCAVAPRIVATMLVGGAFAGLAGIVETSVVQGRLQSDLANGAGLAGFLVAWLAGNRVPQTVALALLVGAVLAAGDGLQIATAVPSSATLVVQGLMFVALLAVGGASARWRGVGHGRG